MATGEPFASSPLLSCPVLSCRFASRRVALVFCRVASHSHTHTPLYCTSVFLDLCLRRYCRCPIISRAHWRRDAHVDRVHCTAQRSALKVTAPYATRRDATRCHDISYAIALHSWMMCSALLHAVWMRMWMCSTVQYCTAQYREFWTHSF